jgi:hypothetical protein
MKNIALFTDKHIICSYKNGLQCQVQLHMDNKGYAEHGLHMFRSIHYQSYPPHEQAHAHPRRHS